MDDQQIQPEAGDKINVGDIKDSNVVAIGAGATAVYQQGLSVEEVAELVDELKNKEQPKVWNGDIPYMGLASFQENDAQFFFGRESLVDELQERVKITRFIVIAGPSGSGKSSVARAGLFHALREGRLDKSDDWLLATMQPKGDPIAELAAAIDRMVKTHGAGDYVRENGSSNPLALHNQIEPLLSEDGRQRCILLVDQFEETFTQTKEADRAPFIELLTEAAGVENGRLTIILSLRSDFVSQCARYPALRTLLNQQFQLVGAMDPPDLAKAITLPALEVGAKIDPELVSRIMADMKGEPGALPLMSFALRDLFEAQKTAKGEPMALTLTGYVERGGIESALERHADNVFDKFTDEQKRLARVIFSKLIEVGQGRADTRRTAVFSELIPAGVDEGAVTAVVHALAEEGVRLITTSGDTTANDDGGERTVTLAHEKLLDAWPWLRQLVDENREMISLQNQINDDARAWAKEKDASFLYRGGRLIQVEEQTEASTPDLNELSQTFIQASLDQRQQEIEEKEAQRRRTITILATAFGVTLVFAAVAFLFFLRSNDSAADAVFQRNEAATSEANALAGEATALAAGTAEAEALADTQEQTTIAQEQAAVAKSRSLATSSLELGHENDTRALLLAITAGQQADTTLAFTALHTQLPFMPLQLQTFSHEASVNGAAWNEDESQILTWGGWSGDLRNSDGEAVLWEVVSGKRLQTFSHESSVNGAIWSKGEDRILTWGSDGTAILWEVESGKRLQTFSHESSVNGAIWSKGEDRILTWSSDGTAALWVVESGKRLQVFSHEDSIKGLAWSEDESQILIWSDDRKIILWATTSGERLQTFSYWDLLVKGMTWNEDGNQILTWNSDGTVVLQVAANGEHLQTFAHDNLDAGTTWNEGKSKVLTWHDDGSMATLWTQSGKRLQTFSHEDSVNGAAWNKDENQILTWSADGTAILWAAVRGKRLQAFSHEDSANGAAWNEDESKILTWSDNGAALWATENGEWLQGFSHEGSIGGAAWNEDESKILTWSSDGTAILWAVTSGARLQTFSHEGSIRGLAWNEDESQILTWSYDGTAVLWTAKSGERLQTFSHQGLVIGATWNKNESQVLTWGGDGAAVLWLVADGERLQIFSHEGMVEGAMWNENEDHILTWSGDGTTVLWGAESGERLQTFSDEERAYGAVWNKDESQILTWGGDWSARDGAGGATLWAVESGERLQTFSHDAFASGAIVSDAMWNEDESQILTLSGDGTVVLWSAADGKRLQTFPHEAAIYGTTWNEDESKILTWSYDGTVKVWDTQTGQPLLIINPDGTSITDAQWNQDEDRLLIATEGGIVRTYYTDMAELIDVACQSATRNFTWNEWQLYFPGETYRCTYGQWPAGEGAPADTAGCQQE